MDKNWGYAHNLNEQKTPSVHTPVLDSNSRHVRIVVDVLKRSDRLLPGDRTNLVIYP